MMHCKFRLEFDSSGAIFREKIDKQILQYTETSLVHSHESIRIVSCLAEPPQFPGRLNLGLRSETKPGASRVKNDILALQEDITKDRESNTSV